MPRSEWCQPGKGTSLRWLCAIIGVPIPAIEDAELDRPTSLHLNQEGETEDIDRQRVDEVVRRVILHGKDDCF